MSEAEVTERINRLLSPVGFDIVERGDIILNNYNDYDNQGYPTPIKLVRFHSQLEEFSSGNNIYVFL
jgi:hypothetical protein